MEARAAARHWLGAAAWAWGRAWVGGEEPSISSLSQWGGLQWAFPSRLKVSTLEATQGHTDVFFGHWLGAGAWVWGRAWVGGEEPDTSISSLSQWGALLFRTKCFKSRFAEVKSPKIRQRILQITDIRISWRFCVGVDFLKLNEKYIVSDNFKVSSLSASSRG